MLQRPAIKGLKEVKKYDKITEAFQELSSGRVDAVVMDLKLVDIM